MSRIDEIIKKMTLEEKAALTIGATAWTTTPIDHLGVPEMRVADGPHGVRRETLPGTLGGESLPATCFPTASCMASTWDVDLVHAVGEALAEECVALKVDVILGPGVNMKRTPLCGRNFEYYSEDPYLAGHLAASYIHGIQNGGVGVSLKHYATNNQESRRMSINAEIDERTLREIYLPAFETAVKNAKPWTVMCAYNKLNGAYGSENHWLLTEILKDEWGFEGLVVSDWGAVHDRVVSLKAGLDLEMPGPRENGVKAVVEAVRSGAIDESLLDEAAHRILSIVFKAAETPKGKAYSQAAHQSLARRAASEGMVLLKNNGILPLKSPKQIAVIGRAAKHPYFQGGGSSHINPTQVDIPYDELQKLAGKSELSYSEGYSADEGISEELIEAAVESARKADVALIFIALPEKKESEGYDRVDLDLNAQHVALIKAVTTEQPNSIVILNNGAPVVMGEWIDRPAAVLEAWMMGQAGGGAIADVLFGKVNPSGKLAETFPIRLVDTPAYINFPGENDKVRYGEGIFIGYRYYDAKQMPVQFPFGYGLSYTTYKYENPKISATTFKDVDGLSVSLDVTNAGKLAGKEVVQVYVHDHKSGLTRPVKELKGFAKLALEPGETKPVSFDLDFRSFAYYHPVYEQWITEDGEFDILIGASSADIRYTQTVTLQSTLRLPSLLKKDSSLRDWLEDRRGRMVVTPLLEQLNIVLKPSFSDNDGQTIGMDVDDFLLDMPILDVFNFKHSKLEAPEEVINELLVKVHSADV